MIPAGFAVLRGQGWGRQNHLIGPEVCNTEVFFAFRNTPPFRGSGFASEHFRSSGPEGSPDGMGASRRSQFIDILHVLWPGLRLVPPPLESSPLAISPPCNPPPPEGDRHFTVLLGNIYFAVVCVPHLSHTRSCIAFPLLRFSHLCVFCDILSPKAVYRVSCPFFRPKVIFPGDRAWYHSRTLGAHVLATVVGPSPNGPQFCHIRYICPGGVTQVDHESAQLSRLEAVVVASPKSLSRRTCGACV